MREPPGPDFAIAECHSLSAVLPSVVTHSARRDLRVRTLIRTLHLWIGVSFGLVLVSQGLSGAVLVWRPEIERHFVPGLTAAGLSGSGGSLDAGVAAVRQAVPDGTVRMLRVAQTAGAGDEWNITVPAAGSSRNGADTSARGTVYVSPATAAVPGIRGRSRDAIEFLVQLHHNLLSGPVGCAVLGYLATATILLALSGLWMWWPAPWKGSRLQPRGINCRSASASSNGFRVSTRQRLAASLSAFSGRRRVACPPCCT